MTKLFKSSTSKNDDGWMQMSLGNSGIDSEDYVVTTQNLHADEVPEAMTDAKTASELIAGLLNAFYMQVDVSKMSEEQVKKIGVVEHEDENNPNQLDLFDDTKRPF